MADDWLFDLWSYQQFCHGEEENKTFLKYALKIAISEELTETERCDVIRYYMEKIPMIDIAAESGRAVSTVSRNISRSRAKLYRVLKYTSPLLLIKTAKEKDNG